MKIIKGKRSEGVMVIGRGKNTYSVYKTDALNGVKLPWQ